MSLFRVTVSHNYWRTQNDAQSDKELPSLQREIRGLRETLDLFFLLHLCTVAIPKKIPGNELHDTSPWEMT